MADEAPPPDWGKIQPLFSNFFVVSASPLVLRIAFGEGFGPGVQPVYHTAIALSHQDALTLAQTVLDTMEKQQQAQAHAGQPERLKDAPA
jgi:hypothetical protein